jgi:hypothetical protein
MVATGNRVTTAGFALTVMALLLPCLAYGTAVMAYTAARPVSVVAAVPAHRPAVSGRSVSVRRPMAATLRGPGSAEDCRGTGYRVIPVRGDISDLAGTEGGHVLWGGSSRGQIACLESVRMWVHYPERENARWLVGIYAHHALRGFIGVRDFILRAGWYYWDFYVGGEFPGTDSVCLTAQFGTGPHLRAVTSCAPVG